jgi:hypothetical protein
MELFMKRRTGLSQIELVLALLIVAVIGGLILVAITRVRDSAARSKCSNNLKQIVLACHNYNDAYQGKLPPLTDQGDNATTGTGLPSLFFLIIPYLEQDAIYVFFAGPKAPATYYAHSSVVFTGSIKGMPVSLTGGTANQIIPAFIDPADTTAHELRDIQMTLPNSATGYYATGSYAANGLVFGSNDAGLPRSFPDGTANTIVFAERPQICRTATGQTVYNLWGLGFYSPHMPAFATLTPDDPPTLLSTGQAAPVVPLPPREQADQMLVRIGQESATPQRPDFATPVQLLRGAGMCDPRLPGSPHFGVMLLAMADGSVRSIARAVSPWIFWAACTPNGKEDLPADW